MGLLDGLLGGVFGGGGGGQTGIGNKQNSNATTNTTTNQYTDDSANAGGDSSIAVGSGASLQIHDLSEGVAKEAIKSGVDQTALATGVASKALDNSLAQTAFVVNTLHGIQETAARENQDTRESADLALRSTTGLTQQLQELTGEALNRAQAPEATSVATIIKPVLIGMGFLVLVIFLFTRNRGERSAK